MEASLIQSLKPEAFVLQSFKCPWYLGSDTMKLLGAIDDRAI